MKITVPIKCAAEVEYESSTKSSETKQNHSELEIKVVSMNLLIGN